MTQTKQAQSARVRRAPRFGAFIGVGVIVGIVVTVALTTSFPADPAVGMTATVAYMSLFGITAGIVLGAVAALIAEQLRGRQTSCRPLSKRGCAVPSAAAIGSSADMRRTFSVS